MVSVAYGDHAVKYAAVDLQELTSLRNKIRAELKPPAIAVSGVLSLLPQKE